MIEVAVTLTVSEWRPGLKSISLMRLIRHHTGCGLGESKRMVEDLLENTPIELQFEDSVRMREFVAEAEPLGVNFSNARFDGLQ
jgi:ribosomal protein L7/L12